MQDSPNKLSSHGLSLHILQVFLRSFTGLCIEKEENPLIDILDPFLKVNSFKFI